MKPNGEIIVRRVEMPLRTWRDEYEWHGGTIARVSHYYIPHTQLKEGSRFWIGPFHVMIVSYEIWDPFNVIVMRVGAAAYLRLFGCKFSRRIDDIYRRSILTLYVWGLADANEGRVPTWRDIRFLRRLSKRWGKN